MSRLVEVQTINRISKKLLLPHTHALSPPDLWILLGRPDHMLSLRLCRVVKRPLQSLHWCNCLLELGSLTSHVYFNLSISEMTFDLAWLWKVRGWFALVWSTSYLHWIVVVDCSSILRYGYISTKSIERSYTLVVQKIHPNTVTHVAILVVLTTGWAKKSKPKTHDRNFVKS